MAGGGALGEIRIMSPQTAALAQSRPTEKYDQVVKSVTKFTTGGWAVFDSDFGCNRQGSVGWFGIGGSVLQWHRELNVSWLMSLAVFHVSSLIKLTSHFVGRIRVCQQPFRCFCK